MIKNLLIAFVTLLVGIGIFWGGYHIASQDVKNFGNANSGGAQVFFSVDYASSTSVLTSNTLTLATSTGRTWAKFSNNSANPIFCRFDNGAPAANNVGFLIAASSTYTMNQLSEPVYTGAINCIAQGGTATVYVEANQ